MFYSFCQTMFNIGASRPISQANEREQKTKELSIPEMAGNPRRGRFSTEGNFAAVRTGVHCFDCFCGRFGDQEMLFRGQNYFTENIGEICSCSFK